MGKNRILLFISVALVAGILFVCAFLAMSSVTIYPKHFFTLIGAPQEVKDMTFIAERDGVQGVSRVLFGGIQTFYFKDWNTEEIVKRGSIMIALLEDVQSEARDIFSISGKDFTPITKDGGFKSSIALSPNGMHIAYVTESDEPAPPEVIYDVARYTVHLLSKDGTEIRTFPGNHPHFIDENILLAFTPQGLTYYSVDSGSFVYAFDPLALLVKDRPAYGDTTAFIVQHPMTHEFLVYEMISKEYPATRPVGTISGEEGDSALTQGIAIYHITRRDGTFAISRYEDLGMPAVPLIVLPEKLLNPLSGVL